MDKISDLLRKFGEGSVNALARLITLVENEAPEAYEALGRLYSDTGHAYVVGITGPPGSGKSTLTDRLIQELRGRGHTVGVLAIDPSSPFSGGALLGDRLRIQEFMDDEGIFFRSMATRGTMGGLARAAAGTIELMDAFGMDYILLETVGVGQDELDIVKTADSTLLVSVPGLGDEIQALKAGTMEIGDIYVVNKADREGALQLATDLQFLCEMASRSNTWTPPIVKTIAIENQGIAELADRILGHRSYLEKEQRLQKKRRRQTEQKLVNMIEQKISRYVHAMIDDGLIPREILDDIVSRAKDPYTFVEEVCRPIGRLFQVGRTDGDE